MQPLDGLRRIWFEIGATQQYDPLGHTEFWVQHRLWGDDTLGYHLVNISLHLTTALTEWRRDVAPLSPLLALGLGAGLLTAWVEQTFVIGGHAVHFGLGPLERVLLAGRAFWFYLGKPFWPAGLVFFHPRWDFSDVESWAFLFPVAAVALAIGAWAFRGRGRGPLAALLFFLALLPALGFIDVYPFRYFFVADHFQYLASLDIFVFASALAATWWKRQKSWRRTAGQAAGLLVLGALAVWPDDPDAHVNSRTTILGLARTRAVSGDAGLRNGVRAVELAERAARLTGDRDPQGLDVPASAYAESGRFGDAAATASAALDLARGAGLDPLAVEIESRLDLYRSGRPFHASGR